MRLQRAGQDWSDSTHSPWVHHFLGHTDPNDPLLHFWSCRRGPPWPWVQRITITKDSNYRAAVAAFYWDCHQHPKAVKLLGENLWSLSLEDIELTVSLKCKHLRRQLRLCTQSPETQAKWTRFGARSNQPFKIQNAVKALCPKPSPQPQDNLSRTNINLKNLFHKY